MKRADRAVKINAALELIMQRLVQQLDESRHHPKLSYFEDHIRYVLQEPGDTPKKIELKLKRILVILGSATQSMVYSPVMLDEEFILALEKTLECYWHKPQAVHGAPYP